RRWHQDEDPPGRDRPTLPGQQRRARHRRDLRDRAEPAVSNLEARLLLWKPGFFHTSSRRSPASASEAGLQTRLDGVAAKAHEPGPNHGGLGMSLLRGPAVLVALFGLPAAAVAEPIHVNVLLASQMVVPNPSPGTLTLPTTQPGDLLINPGGEV